MGDKITARESALKANIPILPGSNGAVTSIKEATLVIKKIGLPVIIKASAGGGGRGMKVVNSLDEFSVFYRLAQSEAQSCFGNPEVYIEKFLDSICYLHSRIWLLEYY